MFFERSQQRFLLISRNNIIGNFKKNRILFLDMLPQKPNVGLCLIDKNFLSNLVFRLHEGNRRKHQSYKTSSLFVFHQHHTDWTSVSQYAAFFQQANGFSTGLVVSFSNTASTRSMTRCSSLSNSVAFSER